ncbi:MAG TPA: threonine--tRNA ligase [Fibrobacteria bacterium]|nr:threonine--tRNA ligase [Fibrobacteria bacterium]
MSTITVTLPNASTLEVESGTPVLEVVRKIGPGLAKSALAAVYNGKELDLSRPLTESGSLRVLTPKDPEAVDIIRHSSAHLMAQAIVELFPGTKLTIGPVIENGFYYDFESPHKFSPEDFPAIEEKMRELAKKDFPVERSEVPRTEAIAYYSSAEHAEPYKVEMMQEWTDDKVSFYKQGPFQDLCRGPHVPSTGKLGHFKLLSVAGAYWRGDEKRPMLQRIYATAWSTKEELERYVFQLEEAKKRDHRRLGKELDYFHMEEGSPGMVFWHARGWRLYVKLMDYVRRKLNRSGYIEVRTPEIVDKQIFVKSGHVANYSHTMFFTESENREYAIKPMNCPCHVEVFKQGIKSFRDLPIRMAEFGKCHRNELAGTMHGLMRVRGFTQDDAHIFCTVDQIADEVAAFCLLLQDVYRDFGFTDILVKLADRPEKRVGSDEAWDKSEAALREACGRAGLAYEMNKGDGAFYGPKLEFTLKDSLGRHWQCGTIQVDYNTAERLGGEYVASDGSKQAPVMLHRAILGSLERFIGILIENFAGDLPFWINPQQVRILPVSEKYLDYCHQINQKLQDAGLISEVDDRNEKIGYKIREGEKDKVPYLIILGEKEMESGKVSLRKRKIGDLGALSLDEALEKFKLELSQRAV